MTGQGEQSTSDSAEEPSLATLALRRCRRDGLIETIKRAVPVFCRLCRERISRTKSFIDWTRTQVPPRSYQSRVGSTTATFHTQGIRREGYDFIDDIDAERGIIERFMEDLEPDDIVYDIGANVGIYACFAAQTGVPEEIVAFEPHPEAFTLLTRNAVLQNGAVETINVGLGERSETAIFSTTAQTAHHQTRTDDATDTVKVRLKRGDDAVAAASYPPPSVLKIDVEGMELSVLRGLERTLSEHVRLVYCEVHPEFMQSYGENPDEILGFFDHCGFTSETIDDGDEDRYFVRAVKDTPPTKRGQDSG